VFYILWMYKCKWSVLNNYIYTYSLHINSICKHILKSVEKVLCIMFVTNCLRIISWTLITVYILQSSIPTKISWEKYITCSELCYIMRDCEMRPKADPNISVPSYVHKEQLHAISIICTKNYKFNIPKNSMAFIWKSWPLN
jgi:hypothetical protein